MSYKFRGSRVDLVFGKSAQRRCELVDVDVWPHKTFDANAVILFRPSDCPKPDSYLYPTDYSQHIARFEAFAAEG